MLTCLSIFVGLFLIVLGMVAIYLGIRTYIYLSSMRLAAGGDMISNQPIIFSHVLTEADPPYVSSKPLFTLASMTVIGLLPLSFGVLLFVRMAGLF